MFENAFSGSAATWAGLIGAMIALPILIHLINLVRHQTVKWAAMDFLLKSHRKHRNWIWLKQLFLLLSRIAALLLVLFLLAQIGCQDDRIAKLLGGATTHHYVLLDDSYSMEDRESGERAFDRATATLSRIVARAKNRQNQKFTLIRFSSGKPTGIDSDTEKNSLVSFDINAELVDTQFDRRVESIKGQLQTTQLAVQPDEALSLVAELIESRADENAIVYVLSDFRKRDWQSAESKQGLIRRIEAKGAGIELIDCGQKQASNLAVSRLTPIGNVRVAGTPMMMEVQVTNYSNSTVKNVQVQLETWEYAKDDFDIRPERLKIDVKTLPTVFIESIPPRESVVQSFPVYFDSTGVHSIKALVDDGSVESDNTRFCSVHFGTSAKVLLIDTESQQESRWLSLVLNPGGTTGVDPVSVGPAFLRDSSEEQLDNYDVVFLLDIDRLDELAIKNLEGFVSRGGGAALFVGPKALPAFYDQLYRQGEGMFPVSLHQPMTIPDRTSDSSDIVPVEHPIFSPATSVKNSLLDLVQVKMIWKVSPEWIAESKNPPDEAGQKNGIPRVLASIRGDESLPLVVEKPFGKGKVMAFMTTAGPAWNNWMRNATFLPIMLLLEDYLATGRYPDRSQLVGTRSILQLDSKQVQREGKQIFRTQSEPTFGSQPFEFQLAEDQSAFTFANELVNQRGVRETWWKNADGETVVDRIDFNVDPVEGDLEKFSDEQFTKQLSSTQVNLVNWDQFNPEPVDVSTSSLNQVLLCA